MIDISLVSRHEGRKSLTDLRDLHRTIQLTGGRVARDAARTALPQTEAEFLEALCGLHRKIFAVDDAVCGGRFRTGDQRALYGGRGMHQREGLACSEIKEALVSLYRSVPASGWKDSSKADFARWAARFMERFFVIHPFLDGNGRVARIMVDWYATQAGRWRWRQRINTRREKEKYVAALEYAHRYVRQNHDPNYHDVPDPYVYLARWIEQWLDDVLKDEELELIEPPNVGDG